MKNDIAQKVAKKLLQINAIKLSPQKPFTWASGLLSPIYCDNRLTLSYPDIRDLIIKTGLKHLAQEAGHFDKIAGVATAGIAHGAILADYMHTAFIYVRSKAKGHGRKNSIEGKLDKGDRILVVEDLISTGKSSIAAAETIRQAGGEPIKVIAIFSYGFPLAASNFLRSDLPFESLCSFESLLDTAVDMDYIKKDEIKMLEDWRANPIQWSKSRKMKNSIRKN